MRVKIKELGDIITGNTPSKKNLEFWDSKDICFIKPDIIADEGITAIDKSNEHIAEAARTKARVVGKDTIFVTCIGSIGKIGIAEEGEYAFNQQINVVVPNSTINARYLAYAILYSKPQLIAIANSAVVPIINKSQFGDFEINIVEDIKQQEEIVNILDRTKGIVESRQQELMKLDELIKARFVEMFGNPITNSKNLEAEKLKDVLILKAGDFTAASDISIERTPTNPYPCYGGNGIRGFVAEYNQDGDYSLIGRQGALSGNVQFARGRFKNTEHALLVKPKIEMDGMWLNQLLIHLDLKRYQTGAAQPGLSVKNLQEIPIILPPLEFQKQFADFVREVDKSREIIQKKIDTYQELFDKLMQEYFG